MELFQKTADFISVGELIQRAKNIYGVEVTEKDLLELFTRDAYLYRKELDIIFREIKLLKSLKFYSEEGRKIKKLELRNAELENNNKTLIDKNDRLERENERLLKTINNLNRRLENKTKERQSDETKKQRNDNLVILGLSLVIDALKAKYYGSYKKLNIDNNYKFSKNGIAKDIIKLLKEENIDAFISNATIRGRIAEAFKEIEK